MSAPVTLKPTYGVPIGTGILAGVVGFWLPIVGLVVVGLALFLAFQARNIQITFTDTAFEVYRGQTLVKSFPYSEWKEWRLYWSGFPVIFYFREIYSIHLIPVLFDAKELVRYLEIHVGKTG